MYDLFFQHINKHVQLTREEEELIKPYLKLKKVRKKQYILQEGEVCKTACFVSKGALRQYYIDESGSEKIVQFALEGWSIGDLFSFLTGEPSQYNIDALEDSEVVLIDRKDFDELTEKLRKFETYGRLMITRAYIALQRRLTSMISLSVEERYEQLLKQYPDIIQRVPQHMIASYMGLTPETLSRARKRAASKE